MIFSVLISGFLMLISGLLNIVPSLPHLPDVITSGITTIYSLVGNATSFVSYIFTPALLVTLFTLYVGLLNFDFVMGTVYWIMRKIPVVNVRK